MKNNLTEKLLLIQSELKAPKNQYNSFGKYKYRSQEDILEAVKPLLAKHGLTLFIRDVTSEIAGIPVVSARAILTDGEKTIETSADAGVQLEKKGMDYAQSFGASSSYARKYALNGLFLIDDTKDSDATNTHGKEAKKSGKKVIIQNSKEWKNGIEKGATLEKMKEYYDFKGLKNEEAYLDDLVKYNTGE